MSTAQVEGTVRTLDANTVQEILAAAEANRMVTVQYPFTLSIYENFGRAFISWQLDPNYAIGDYDRLYLMEGAKLWGDLYAIKAPSGVWDTGHSWGSGLNASYWAFNHGASAGWRVLVTTPNT